MEFKALVRLLIDILQGARIPYMVVGGLAVEYWGFPRATFDVDLVVALQPRRIEGLTKPLARYGFDLEASDVAEVLRVGNRFMTRSPRIAYRIDFWIPRTQYEQEAFKRKRRARMFGRTCWLIAPEDLILMKLLAGRGKDLDDAQGVVTRQAGELDWNCLLRWAGALNVKKTLEQLRQTKQAHGPRRQG